MHITCTLSRGCSPALPAAGVPHSSLSPSILRLCIFLSFSLRVRHAPLTPNFECLPSVQVLESRERSPTSSLVPRVIEHFLYAPRNVPPEAELTSLALGVDELPHLSTAEALPAEAWVALLREFIIERPCVAVVGKPSAELAASLAAGVTERLAATRQALGEEGLAQAASRLEAAVRVLVDDSFLSTTCHSHDHNHSSITLTLTLSLDLKRHSNPNSCLTISRRVEAGLWW